MRVSRGRRTSRRGFSIKRGHRIAPDVARRATGSTGISEIGRRRLLALISSTAMLWVLMVPPPPAAAAVTFAVDSIESGKLHSCLVTSSGDVYCWGLNDSGQLGIGNTEGRVCEQFQPCEPTPMRVTGLPAPATRVSAGYASTCAVTPGAATEVWCWGSGYGPTAVEVLGLPSGVEDVSVGDAFSCALATGPGIGDVYCWGYPYGASPSMITGIPDPVVAISAGGGHACAVTNQGAAYCWGYNRYGQLGDNTTDDSSTTPVGVMGLNTPGSGVTSISAGWWYTCAVVGGAAMCWGHNREWQLGTGDSISRLSPYPVSGLGSGVDSITAGGDDTCAIMTTTRELNCWGRGAVGSDVPQDMGYAVDAVSVGTDSDEERDASAFVCSLESGTVRCGGRVSYGELGTGSIVRTNPSGGPLAEDLSAPTVSAMVVQDSGFACYQPTDWLARDPLIYWLGRDVEPSSGLLPGGNWYSTMPEDGEVIGDGGSDCYSSGYVPNHAPVGLADGIHYFDSPSICDRKGNCSATITRQVRIDKTAPLLGAVTFSPSSSPGGATLNVPETFTISVSPTDALSGIGSVEYYIGTDNGEGRAETLDTSNNVTWSKTVSLPVGTNTTIGVRVQDVAGLTHWNNEGDCCWGSAPRNWSATAVTQIEVVSTDPPTPTGESASGTVPAGGSVTTDPAGDGASATDPVEATVTSPVAGPITITEGPLTGTPPPGYEFVGSSQLIQITANPAVDNMHPLVFDFYLDNAGPGWASIELRRNSALVAYPCSGVAGQAFPDPCIDLKEQILGDDLHLRVLSTRASIWDFVVASRPPFNFTGFSQPVDNVPVVNKANAGQTIAVKWRITNGNGIGISDPASFVSITSGSTSCSPSDPIDAIETYSGSSGLQYLGNGNWQFNWKTPKSYAGQCRVMRLNLADGTTTRIAEFLFK